MGIGSAETAPEAATVENLGSDAEVGPFHAGPTGPVFGFQYSKTISITRDLFQ